MITFPSLVLLNPITTYNPTEAQTRLGEEDAFKNGDALHGYDMLTVYLWA